MKQKINLLIAFSALVLIVLTLVQYYLVKTTYDHKVEQFRSEVKDKIGKITNDYSAIDATIFNKKDQLYKQFASNYIQDKEVKFHLKNALFHNEFKEELTRKLRLEFQKEIPDIAINFAIVLNKFILYDATKAPDTLFAEKPLISNKMYGDLASLDGAFLIRNYVGTTSGTTLNTDFKLLTEDTLYVAVLGWEQIVLKRMMLILMIAVFSMLTVITLFVIAIKALIQQKKVSDVKTDFINNITHELKTPLTTLSVSTKILGRKDIQENHAVFANVLSTIDRQNNRLQNLIDQVMVNALGHEEIELQKEKLHIHSFLTTIIQDFKIAYPNVVVSVDFYEKETTLILDAFYLTTALSNVLENAVKYGCKTINVATNMQNNQFSISIKDDGIGISKNKQSLLFDKFYRVEQGNLHNSKGLGLGLYYVDQIVKAHHGNIKVASELGKGTTFDFRFMVLEGAR